MNKISMKEAAAAWGSGKDVEWGGYRKGVLIWADIPKSGFCFNQHVEYRLKPEVTTSLSDDVLRRVYYGNSPFPDLAGREGHAPWFHEALKAVAGAAIKQYVKENPK